MKLSPLLLVGAAISLFSSSAIAWTNEDHEIFDIVSALESAEGKGTNFYSFLNVTKSATEKEISRSYRKRSLELHPDKNPNDKHGEARFARLGTIAGILRDAEKRARYDHFYENGVPRWRGTGYYYSRYRPGLTGVLIFLILFSNIFHYAYLLADRFVTQERIKSLQTQCLTQAWGADHKPKAGRKRLMFKTNPDGISAPIPGINGGRPTPPGYNMEIVVEELNVYIVENKEEILIDVTNAVSPKFFRDTWLPLLLKSYYLRLTGQQSPSTSSSSLNSDGEEEEEVVQVGKDGKKTVVVVKKPKGPGRGVELGGKVGGRRRKVVAKPSAGAKKE